MSAVLCAGPVFDVEALEQNGCLYGWIDSLLDCGDEKVDKSPRKNIVDIILCSGSSPRMQDGRVSAHKQRVPSLSVVMGNGSLFHRIASRSRRRVFGVGQGLQQKANR